MTTRFLLDPVHSSIAFSVRHLVVAKVRGQFTRFSGTLDLDTEITRSIVTAQIEAASISTGDAKRDAHLRSSDFLDTDRFPSLAFASTRIERKNGVLLVMGRLAIRDVDRPVTLEVDELGTMKDPTGLVRVAFAARGAIERKDFGLAWNQALETGGVLVGDKIELTFDLQGVKATEHAVTDGAASRSVGAL